jgi:hypothetical protein
MKEIFFAAIFLINLKIAAAQNPEPIYSFAVVRKSSEYYKQQATLWKKEIDKNKHNANAWYNYYRVNRNILGTDTTDHRDWKVKQKSQMDLVEQMGKEVPMSFEFNLCKWMMSGNNYSDIKYLKAAAELGKHRIEICNDMINWGEIERNITRRNEFAKKYLESNQSSPGMLNYNYNVLIGLKKNAIILTCGDNDTYPLWQLQATGIRTDVTVINLSLIEIDSYREKLFKELEIVKLDSEEINRLRKSDSNFSEVFINHITKYSLNHPVYIGLTVDLEYAKSIQDSLYLVGMAYEYSTSNIDNVAVLRYNFEQVYALDYLTTHFYNDISEELSKEINANYIVPMLKLFTHYHNAGDEEKQKWIWKKIIAVGEKTNQEKLLKEYLEKN